MLGPDGPEDLLPDGGVERRGFVGAAWSSSRKTIRGTRLARRGRVGREHRAINFLFETDQVIRNAHRNDYATTSKNVFLQATVPAQSAREA